MMYEKDYVEKYDKDTAIHQYMDRLTYYVITGESIFYTKKDNKYYKPSKKSMQEEIELAKTRIVRYIVNRFKTLKLIPNASWGNIFKAKNGTLQFDFGYCQCVLEGSLKNMKETVDKIMNMVLDKKQTSDIRYSIRGEYQNTDEQFKYFMKGKYNECFAK